MVSQDYKIFIMRWKRSVLLSNIAYLKWEHYRRTQITIKNIS